MNRPLTDVHGIVAGDEQNLKQSMKAFIVGERDYGCFLWFGESAGKAKDFAANYLGIEFIEVDTCKRAPEVDHLFEKFGEGECMADEALYLAGFLGEEGGWTCDTCSRGEFESIPKSLICRDCNQCGECVCDCTKCGHGNHVQDCDECRMEP